jgi:1-acyl-sn-glycerol-3-phosphate acyltransferase
VGQRIMGVAARALAHGEWLHIFPEGRVTPDGKVGPFRQGIGRLVCDAKAAAGGRYGRGQELLPLGVAGCCFYACLHAVCTVSCSSSRVHRSLQD